MKYEDLCKDGFYYVWQDQSVQTLMDVERVRID